MNLCLAALLLPGASCWSRLNVGTVESGPNKGKVLTCSGAIMSEQIAKNIRGENPDVPVSLIARFPMLNPAEKFVSDFHVYSAIVLMVVMWTNFLGPKGNDPNPGKAKFHVYFGRLLSWCVSPHYAAVGFLLNYYAITAPKMEDWLLGANLTGWRVQLGLIGPMGFLVGVTLFMGFFLNRYKFMPASPWCSILKAASAFSVFFWCTIGVYTFGSQALGGIGGFWYPIEEVLDGGLVNGDTNQVWFRHVSFIALFGGFGQAFMDYTNYKILSIVQKTGNEEIAWKDMHKWAMLVLGFEGGFVAGLVVVQFPFCLYGFPEWMCFDLFACLPIAALWLWPVALHGKWIYAFLKALYGGKIAEFSKPNHKWDKNDLMLF